MTDTAPPKRRRIFRWFFFFLIFLVALYAVAGFVAIPYFIETKLASLAEEHLQRPARIKDFSLNPFTLRAEATDVALDDADGSPFVAFERFVVDIDSTALVSKTLVFSELTLDRPSVDIEVLEDESFNFSDLLPEDSEEAEVEEESGEMIPMAIRKLRINEGQVFFEDRSRQSKFATKITPISLALDEFSTATDDSAAPYAFKAALGDGGVLDWSGDFTLSPLSSAGSLQLEALPVKTVWSYIQDNVAFEISDGNLSVSCDYDLTTGSDDEIVVTVESGKAAIAELALGRKGADGKVISVPSFDVDGVRIGLSERKIDIANMTASGVSVEALLDPETGLNLTTLFSPAAASDSAVDAAEDSAASEATEPPANAEASEEADGDAFKVSIGAVSLTESKLTFTDNTAPSPAKFELAPVSIKTKQVEVPLVKPIDFEIDLTANAEAKVTIDGTMMADPFSVDLNLDLKDVPMNAFEPYLQGSTSIDIPRGLASFNGKLGYGAERKGSTMDLAGALSTRNVTIRERGKSGDLITWSEIVADDLRLKLTPGSLDIGTLTLRKPTVRAALEKSGMNLSRAFSPPGKKAETADNQEAESSDPFPIKIKRVKLLEADASFTDRSISPSVAVTLDKLSGTVAGLSSAELARADVDLTGKVNKYAPFKITGKINPLSDNAFTDLIVQADNIDLTSFSPYSEKFAGYAIDKGKLHLNLGYKLSKRSLRGENDVVLDQFTLGGKTKSSDAPPLPIPLAVALLKNHKGEIDIDLPVRGNLDDPEFSYGRMIGRALINLITQVATSPFSIVGNVGGMVGGMVLGEKDADFSRINFEPAGHALSEIGDTKLRALAGALGERPQLDLAVSGSASAEQDSAQLRETKLDERVKELYIAELRRRRKAAPESTAEVVLTDEERAELIEELYEQSFSERSRTFLKSLRAGLESGTTDGAVAEAFARGAADGSVDEDQRLIAAMRARLLEQTPVTEDDLRRLATSRAETVRDRLIAEGGIDASRVFLKEASVIESGAAGCSLELTGK